MRVLGLLSVILAAATVITVSAASPTTFAAGGTSIANAPPLPLGTEVASGALRTRKFNNLPWAAEYWKVSMASGYRLVLDYGATNQLGVGACVLGPDVTDFVEQTAQCLGSAITGDKTEMRFVAPVTGAYTLRFSVNACQCTDPLSYNFLARVVMPTTMTLHAPAKVRHGANVLIRGVVTGVATGKVAVKVGGPLNRRKVVPIRSGGRFSTSFALPSRGQYTVTATFYGDPSHAQVARSLRIAAT